MEKALILAARRFDFADDKSGKQVEGVSLTYLTGDVESSADSRGCQPMTVTGPVDVFASLRDVPGLYSVEFKQRPGRNGRPTLQCVGLDFVQAVSLSWAE